VLLDGSAPFGNKSACDELYESYGKTGGEKNREGEEKEEEEVSRRCRKVRKVRQDAANKERALETQKREACSCRNCGEKAKTCSSSKPSGKFKEIKEIESEHCTVS
jgi:hypothetical protein